MKLTSVLTDQPVLRLMKIKQHFGLGGYLHLVWELREQQEPNLNRDRLTLYHMKRLKLEGDHATH